jgi:hypothetical protein
VSTTLLGTDTNAVLVSMALSLAKRHNLVCDDGTIVCWNCRQAVALLPSLHCNTCLGQAYHRLGIVEPLCMQQEQQEK